MAKASTTLLLTAGALLGFAANSLLCRKALAAREIDPASFTAIRIGSGAIALSLLVALARTSRGAPRAGGWAGAFALFAYAILFSLAYLHVHAGTGALILFGAVQMTMLAAALARGERLAVPQWCGWALALLGLYGLSWRRSATAEPLAALSMAAAGVAWGAYTLLGRGSKAPLAATCGNFRRAVPLAIVALAVAWPWSGLHASARGIGLACVSGALTSGVGYALWYAALRGLRTTQAAFLQLLVPVLAALLAVPLLGEPVTLALCLWGSLILGGVALALRRV